MVESLETALTMEVDHRSKVKAAGSFLPEWKNLKTWVNNQCWDQEFPVIVESTRKMTHSERVAAKILELSQPPKDDDFVYKDLKNDFLL